MSYDKDETLKTVQLMDELDKLIVEIRQRNKNTEILKEGTSVTSLDKGVSIIERGNFIERAQQLRKSIYQLEDNSKKIHMVQQMDDLVGELKNIKPVMPDPAYLKIYKRYELLMNNLDDNLRSKKQIQAVISDLKMIRDELKQLQTAINKYGIAIKESEYSPEINEKERYLSQVIKALDKVEGKLKTLKKYDVASTKETKMTLTERAEYAKNKQVISSNDSRNVHRKA